MVRSLYAGVSGLQNHQTRMDVIGNNISNVNTTGFKKGRVNFQDMLSQTMSGAAKPTNERGGINPKQVGLGMSVASIDTIHTQGNLQSTGVSTDVAILGNGFFVMRDGSKEMYSRAGAFNIDQDGYLVNPNGLRIQGWNAQQAGGEVFVNSAAPVEDLRIPVGGKDAAKATTSVDLACNLDKRFQIVPPGATEAETRQGTWTSSITTYDSLGQEHVLEFSFTKDPGGAPNVWQVNVDMNANNDADGFETNPTIAIGDTELGANQFYVTFDNTGVLAGVGDTPDNIIADEGQLAVALTFDVPNTTAGEDGAPFQQTMNLNLGTVGSAEQSMTQFAESASTKPFRQDGYGMGYLETFRIDDRGSITGVFSNGQLRELGQMALATFTNPGGLEKAGDSTFMQSINSGLANVGTSGVAGRGYFKSGALEMSNVDLSGEFTDMIVTQRGFQSNSKTIQTSDQMLQELLTLKR